MRNAMAAQKLAKQFDVDPGDNGLERFITATRRQNFLVPPRSLAGPQVSRTPLRVIRLLLMRKARA
jgi:hypothetical protein